MTSIDIPTRLPRVTSLGILAGITNMNRLNRLTRMTRLPILGKLVKMVKMLKLVGAHENDKMLKPAGPKIDAGGKMVKTNKR